jgi:hypothetical protein
MSTYNNVLGNFISHSNDLSDFDDDDYDDSASEPEPEMGNRNMSSRPNVLDGRSQIVESLLSKSNKHAQIHVQTYDQGFFFLIIILF